MTGRLFLDHPDLARADATVISSAPEGIVLDRTVFYASLATLGRYGGQAAKSRLPTR
jgi:Ser-tRNA(Ala) deacylase AlaX